MNTAKHRNISHPSKLQLPRLVFHIKRNTIHLLSVNSFRENKSSAIATERRSFYRCLILFLYLMCYFSSGYSQNVRSIPSVNIAPNLTSFIPLNTYPQDIAKQYNSGHSQNNPDFGILPIREIPGFFEVIDRRDATSRFFRKVDNPSIFYIKKSAKPVNYKKDGYWRAINTFLDYKGNGIYKASWQPAPTLLNVVEKKSGMVGENNTLYFNDVQLKVTYKNSTHTTFDADWSNYTVGSNGIYVTDVFPQFDMQLVYKNGGVKSTYILKQKLPEIATAQLIDQLDFGNGALAISTFGEKTTGKPYYGDLYIGGTPQNPLYIYEAVVGYDKPDTDVLSFKLPYIFNNSTHQIAIVIDSTITNSSIYTYPIYIDPSVIYGPVNGTPLIGSGTFVPPYFDSCTTSLTLTFPGGSTPVDFAAQWELEGGHYCWEDGNGQPLGYSNEVVAWFNSSCGGVSPLDAGMDSISPTAGGIMGYGCVPCSQQIDYNQSIPFNAGWATDSLMSCYTPSCLPQDITIDFSLSYTDREQTFAFGLPFSRGPLCGCSYYDTLYGAPNLAASVLQSWQISVMGKYIQTIADTTIVPIHCSNIALDPNPQYGVPPYTYIWTTVETTPTIIIDPNVYAGQTIGVTVTDACGDQESTNFNIANSFLPPAVSANSPVCLGDTLSLSTSPWAAIYSWSGPNGFSSGLQNPVLNPVTMANAGIYQIVISDGLGCTDSATVNVTVNSLPTATASSNSPICEGEPLSLYSNGGASYYWMGPDSTVASLQEDPVFTPPFQHPDSGTYIVTVTDANGCTDTATVEVTIYPAPIVNASFNAPVCEGSIMHLYANPTIAGGSYSWIGPGGYTSNQQNSDINPVALTDAGFYQVSVSDTNGCGGDDNVYVSVSPLPTPSIDPVADLCMDSGLISLGAQPGGGTFFGAGVTGTAFDPAAAGVGVHTITYVYTDGNSCSAQSTIQITVNPPCNCTADVGTYATNLVGNSNSTGLTINLCYGDEFQIIPNGDKTNPQIVPGSPWTYDPGLGGLLFSCPPSVFPPNDFNNDTCLVGITPLSLTGQWNFLNTSPPNHLYFVPTTMYSISDLKVSYSPLPPPTCYDLGLVYTITFLTEITCTSLVEDCHTATAVATISGGGPEIYGTSFTASNLSPPTASFVNTTCGNGGTITITGLQDGDIYSFYVTDLNDCSLIVVGTFQGVENAGFNYAGSTYCQSAADPAPSITGVAGGFFTFLPTGLSIDSATGEIDLSATVPGTYSVTYTTPDPICSSDSTVQIQIIEAPVIDPVNDFSICANTPVPAIPFSGTSGAVFNWTNSNTTIGLTASGTGNIASFLGVNPTGSPATATLTVTPVVSGCVGASETFTITLNPSPSFTVSYSNPTSCSTIDGTLTLSGLNPNTTYAVIYLDNGVLQGPLALTANALGDIVIANLNAGTYSNFTVDLNGCVGVDTNPVMLTAPSSPSVDAPANISVCANTLVPAIPFSGTSGAVFNWTNSNTAIGLAASGTGNITSFLGVNPTGSPATAALTVTPMISGCVGLTKIFTITVNSLPQIHITSSEKSGCAPLTVHFANMGSDAITCEWDFGDGSISGSCAYSTHEYTSEGCYDVTLEVTNQSGCVNQQKVNDFVCLFAVPKAGFIIDSSVVDELDTKVEFTNTSIDADYFLWKFYDTAYSSEENPIHHFPSEPGLYEVTLIAYTVEGCTDTATSRVRVKGRLIYYVPNAFTPDADGLNDLFFPVLQNVDPDNYTFCIFNRWGQLVWETHNIHKKWNGTRQGTEYLVEPGLYIWKITLHEVGTTEVKKLNGHLTVLR